MRLQRIFMWAALFILAPQASFAHAIILSSTPAANTVLEAPSNLPVSLRFNSRIDHARSKLSLFAPDGTEQPLTPAADSPADGLSAETKPLTPGAWRLHWQVLSVDGHITRGDIPFTIK